MRKKTKGEKAFENWYHFMDKWDDILCFYVRKYIGSEENQIDFFGNDHVLSFENISKMLSRLSIWNHVLGIG